MGAGSRAERFLCLGDGKEWSKKEIPQGWAGNGGLPSPMLRAKASLWRAGGAGLPGDSCKNPWEASSKHCGLGLGNDPLSRNCREPSNLCFQSLCSLRQSVDLGKNKGRTQQIPFLRSPQLSPEILEDSRSEKCPETQYCSHYSHLKYIHRVWKVL